MSGNQTNETASEESTTVPPMNLQIAECRKSRRMEREVKSLTTGA
jgi:hypothetical protein